MILLLHGADQICQKTGFWSAFLFETFQIAFYRL
jgi:hypothetical protein